MKKNASRRPWQVNKGVAEQCKNLFPGWLKSRGGIVVYENHMMDSSRMGDKTFMPARFIAQEDDQMHDAPEELRPHGGLPSCRQQLVDHIEIEEYGGDVVETIKQAFAFDGEGDGN